MAHAGSTLEGAGTGAATGAAIGSFFPGAGTAIGAGVGGLAGGIAGFFSGRQRHEEQDRREQRRQQRQDFIGRRRETESRALSGLGKRAFSSPFESEIFRSSIAQLMDQQQRRAERQGQAAAARGLTGTEFEVAQQAQRGQRFAQGQRQARRSAVEGQRSALLDILQGAQSSQQIAQGGQRIDLERQRQLAQERRRRNQALQGAAFTIPQFFGQGFGSQGGGGGQS